MRKYLIYIVFFLGVGLVVGYLMHLDPGYVLLSFNGYRIETSIWAAAILFILLFFPLHILLSFYMKLRVPKLRGWNRNRLAKRARQMTNKGMLAFAQGNWKSAQKLLTNSAPRADTTVINYLTAARAASEQGQIKQSEELIRKAHQVSSNDDIAVNLTHAELQYERGQNEQCLATLLRLQKRVPHHPQVLKLLKLVYTQLEDWEQLSRLLPVLEKQNVITRDNLKSLEVNATLSLLSKVKTDSLRQDSTQKVVERLKEAWSNLPTKLQKHPDIIHAYAEHIISLGKPEDTEMILQSGIKQIWDDRLVRMYGLIEGKDPIKQLLIAEYWLKERPNSGVLLLTLGRLALRAKNWVKAQEYLEASVKLHRDFDAYAELCRLFAAQGKLDQCVKYFQQGVEKELPLLPLPENHAKKESDNTANSSEKPMSEHNPVNH